MTPELDFLRGCCQTSKPDPVIQREPPRKPLSAHDVWRRPKDLACRAESRLWRATAVSRTAERVLRSRPWCCAPTGFAWALPQDDCSWLDAPLGSATRSERAPPSTPPRVPIRGRDRSIYSAPAETPRACTGAGSQRRTARSFGLRDGAASGRV